MNILAIDTAGPRLSAAIAKGEKLIARYESKKEKSHSDALAPAVEKLLRKCRLKPGGIDLYAISIGPGSFTGLRIGVAFIKGMNLFFNKPVACVPTLDALAETAGAGADYVCPIVDAKRQNVYAAIYKRGKRILGYSVIPFSEMLKKLKAIAPHLAAEQGPAGQSGKIVFVGDGLGIYKAEISKEFGRNAVFAEKSEWYSKADVVARLGFRMYNKNKGVAADLRRLSPMYLYPKDVQCQGVKICHGRQKRK